MPLGPSPTLDLCEARAGGRHRDDAVGSERCATYAALESGIHATPRGSPIDWKRSSSGIELDA
jgi:hypothetical protein